MKDRREWSTTEGTRRLLATLREERPSLLDGSFKAPGTLAGSQNEKHWPLDLSRLLSQSVEQKGAVLLVVPNINRCESLSGVGGTVANQARTKHHVCCVGVTEDARLLRLSCLVLSRGYRVPTCVCSNAGSTRAVDD